MGFLGVLRVKMWKCYLITPKRHYPAWIRVCWCMHYKIGSTAWALGPWKDFAHKEEIYKKLSGNFGYMGRSNHWGDLDQMRLVGRYRGRNHVCNISWLSVKGCGCGETVRGASLPSPIDFTRRPYNTGHTPCDRDVITQPESWYSFYHPTEGRRLSRPSWLVTYRDCLPVHRQSPILVLTGSDVAQLRWSRPTRYH